MHTERERESERETARMREEGGREKRRVHVYVLVIVGVRVDGWHVSHWRREGGIKLYMSEGGGVTIPNFKPKGNVPVPAALLVSVLGAARINMPISPFDLL